MMNGCQHKNISPIKWVGNAWHIYCAECDKNLVLKNCTIQNLNPIEPQEGIEVEEWKFTCEIAEEKKCQ